MTEILAGERIGRQGKLRLGCSAVIFDEAKKKVLLTRRADNGRWCLPSGGMEPGETLIEACIRETREETGLDVRVTRLTGVYSSPDHLVVYPGDTRVQIVAMNFEAIVTGGRMALSNETTEIGYFTLEEMKAMNLVLDHQQRILDARMGQEAAFIR